MAAGRCFGFSIRYSCRKVPKWDTHTGMSLFGCLAQLEIREALLSLDEERAVQLSERLAAPDQSSDHELVMDMRRGAVAAFGLLFDRYNTALRGSLARQTGDPELAADLAQETFLIAFQGIDRLREDQSFGGWLFGIAHKRMLMEWRRRKLRHVLSLDWLPAGMAASAPALRAEDDRDWCELRDAIQDVLDALEPALRDALVLNRLAGFQSAEIARILGISDEAARKRILRARRRFVELYDGELRPHA